MDMLIKLEQKLRELIKRQQEDAVLVQDLSQKLVAAEAHATEVMQQLEKLSQENAQLKDQCNALSDQLLADNKDSSALRQESSEVKAALEELISSIELLVDESHS